MKIYKKIILGFIVMITILGLVAFYSPIPNIRQSQPVPESKENYSASVNDSASSTPKRQTPDVPTSKTSTSISEKASFENMSGFSELGRESDLIEEMGVTSTPGSVEDIFNELNK